MCICAISDLVLNFDFNLLIELLNNEEKQKMIAQRINNVTFVLMNHISFLIFLIFFYFTFSRFYYIECSKFLKFSLYIHLFHL